MSSDVIEAGNGLKVDEVTGNERLHRRWRTSEESGEWTEQGFRVDRLAFSGAGKIW